MTGWGVRYRCTHMDFWGHVWTVDLLLEGYSGAIEEATAGGVPIQINTLGEGDSEAGVKPKEWIVEFVNQTSFQFMNVFTGTARDYLAKIYKDNALYAMGWCDPDNYSEEFTSDKYPSRIHIHDGLGELKDIYFSMPSNPGTFDRTLLYYISLALSQTGFDLPIHIASDIIFKKKDGTEITSLVFANLTVDWRVFRTGESSFWSYYEIVTNILAAFEGVRIFQENGAWWIERAGVMKTASYNYEKYTAGPDSEYVNTFSKDPVLALTSNSIGSDKIVRFGSDCELTIVPPWKRHTINQSFGVKPTILKARNLFGTLYSDDWRTEDELWYYSRNNVTLIKNEDSSFRIPGFVYSPDLYPDYVNFLQSDTVYIENDADVLKLRESWGDTPLFTGKGTHIGMRLSVEYFLKASAFISSEDKLRFFLRVSLVDDDGKVWNTTNRFDNDAGEHIVEPEVAWFDPDGSDPDAIIEIVPTVNEWAGVDIRIPNCALRGDESGLTRWGFFLKIYQAISDKDTGNPARGDGLIIRSIKLGFYDRANEDGTRKITQEINEKNRFVPGDVSLLFGDSPGHWGAVSPYTGQEFMDLYIFKDLDGNPVTSFGTVASGTGSGLIEGIMTNSLYLKHHKPLFKLRGPVRDNPSSMDFCTSIQDYDGRVYSPTGMSRDTGSCIVDAEWVQIREPEQGAGGEFNWDFSNDFNI